MAFIENTAFEPRIVNNEFDALCNITGKYIEFSGDTPIPADCSAGILCTKADSLPCEGFPGVVNENAYAMAADVSYDGTMPIYACNQYDAKRVGGYYLGTETLGLGAAANEYCTFTRINFDGQSVYRFGVGNLKTDLGTNVACTIEGGTGLLVPTNSIPQSGVFFLAVGTGNFTTGTSDSFGYVDFVACKA